MVNSLSGTTHSAAAANVCRLLGIVSEPTVHLLVMELPWVKHVSWRVPTAQEAFIRAENPGLDAY